MKYISFILIFCSILNTSLTNAQNIGKPKITATKEISICDKSLFTNNINDINIAFSNIGSYLIDMSQQNCIKCEISNNSDNDYLLWVERIDSLNQEQDSLKYFKKKIGMFSIMNIINEYGSTLEIDNLETFPQLYTTFFKVINPHEKFHIYILYSNSINEAKIRNSIKLLQLDYSNIFNSYNNDIFKSLSYRYNNLILHID